jgi:glycosyltransferase involved in cell wall biosynthesis
MRIAVAYSYRTRIGGIETYLDTVMKGLAQSGHHLSYWYEVKSDSTSEQIELPDGVTAWCFEELGIERALDALREWRPDIIYVQGFLDQDLEQEVLKVAPAVIFAHGFYGTCISGSKTFTRPNPIPCNRRFGPMCLVNYHARGCGGLNPLTMFRDYARQSGRLRSLQTYRAIITASEFMRAEFIRNGVSAEKVYAVSLPLSPGNNKTSVAARFQNGGRRKSLRESGFARPDECADSSEASTSEWRLLFLGRMTRLKGGEVLIDALTKVRAMLEKPVRVTFAGDGPERRAWKTKAERVQARDKELDISFPGWLSGEQLEATLHDSDLLVVPSLWPEPFGLVGPEAGLRMLPAAAFSVGGIPDWLSPGVNGFLAPGDPPSADGLAEAITKCLQDPTIHASLREGAFELAQRFSMRNHLEALLKVFANVTGCDFQASTGIDRRSVTAVTA